MNRTTIQNYDIELLLHQNYDIKKYDIELYDIYRTIQYIQNYTIYIELYNIYRTTIQNYDIYRTKIQDYDIELRYRITIQNYKIDIYIYIKLRYEEVRSCKHRPQCTKAWCAFALLKNNRSSDIVVINLWLNCFHVRVLWFIFIDNLCFCPG